MSARQSMSDQPHAAGVATGGGRVPASEAPPPVDVTTRPLPAQPAPVGRDAASSVSSVAAVILAFLASQHHTIHMLILMVATGSAGMSFMAAYPAVRRGMLALSLAAAGVALYLSWGRPGRGHTSAAPGTSAAPARHLRGQQITSAVSVILTLLLAGWSIYEFGL